MSENKRDYEVGRGKPPVHTRFKKGQSGNPRGPRPKNLPALLVEALNEKVTVTSMASAARSPSARRSPLSWSTNRPVPICTRPRC
jgi:hypothetical protein